MSCSATRASPTTLLRRSATASSENFDAFLSVLKDGDKKYGLGLRAEPAKIRGPDIAVFPILTPSRSKHKDRFSFRLKDGRWVSESGGDYAFLFGVLELAYTNHWYLSQKSGGPVWPDQEP